MATQHAVPIIGPMLEAEVPQNHTAVPQGPDFAVCCCRVPAVCVCAAACVRLAITMPMSLANTQSLSKCRKLRELLLCTLPQQILEKGALEQVGCNRAGHSSSVCLMGPAALQSTHVQVPAVRDMLCCTGLCCRKRLAA